MHLWCAYSTRCLDTSLLTCTIVPSTTNVAYAYTCALVKPQYRISKGVCRYMPLLFMQRSQRASMNSHLRGERELDLEEDRDLDRFLHQSIGDHMLQ